MSNVVNKKSIGVLVGLIGFMLPFLIHFEGLSEAGHHALSIFLVAAAFWMFEPIPIFSTSMMVILLEVLLISKQGFFGDLKDFQAPSYAEYMATLASPTIILFLGGFMLADAAVKYNFDKNLTRVLLKPFGNKPAMIMLGLMIVTALLSAFMSNTATTAMMMTVIIPILAKIKGKDPFKVALALCVPFAANIGGIATPIGTPPNAVVLAALNKIGISISFGTWMAMATPYVLIMLAFCWVLLKTLYKPQIDTLDLSLKSEMDTSKNAKIFYVIFTITVLGWITESQHHLKSGIVALIPVVGLTTFGILTKEEIRKLPWDVLWLVAGGFALGIAMQKTGLASWMINSIEWSSFTSITLLALFTFVGFALANFLSHTVTATLIIPLVISLGALESMEASFNTTIAAIVVGIGTSIAMSLPISTPPNAIAMSTGLIETPQMTKSGVTVGIVGFVLLLVISQIYWTMFF